MRSAAPAHALRLPGRMAPTDALFWYAESALANLRPLIAGLFTLEHSPDPERVEAAYQGALLRIPRLRQRVVEPSGPLGLPEWRDDPHFDPRYHLRHVSLPAPGARRELLDLAATLLATPLDRERPLWEAYWIDGLEGGRAACFLKLHHSVVDGVGALALLDALTQPAPDTPLPPVRYVPPPPPAPASLLDGVGDALGAALGLVRETAALTLRGSMLPVRAALEPAASARQLWGTLRGLQGFLTDLARAPIEDPLARGSAGISRRLDVTEFPLGVLQALRRPFGATLNDLMLALFAGALGRYHRERDVHVEALHCMVPMSLRSREERDRLGNRVGVFTVRLPLGETHPRRRLEQVMRQTGRAKRDQRGAAAPLLMQGLSLLPGSAFRWLARRSLGRVNVVLTNVPGVREARYMGGARVEAIHPFASVVEGTPVVLALLSYGDTLHAGLDTDPEAIPDPERIVELLHQGLHELEEATP